MKPALRIRELILTERRRQIEKWGKQLFLPVDWLIVLNEEMGEYAQADFDNSDGESFESQLAEVVQIAAMGVQIAEAVSELCGWPNTSEQALDNALGYLPLSDEMSSKMLYVRMMATVGRMAQEVSELDSLSHWTRALLHNWSNDVRALICQSYLLIGQLQIINGSDL